MVASSLRINGNTTIRCRYLLGADVRSGTIAIDRGIVADVNLRLASLAGPEAWEPGFPIDVDSPGGGASTGAADRSAIRCTVTAGEGTIFFSP